MDLVKALLDTELPVPSYRVISKIPATGKTPLTHVRTSPILAVIWITSSPRFREG